MMAGVGDIGPETILRRTKTQYAIAARTPTETTSEAISLSESKMKSDMTARTARTERSTILIF